MSGRPASVVLAAVLVLVIGTAIPAHLQARLHPLHTTLTELRYDARTAALTGTIRIFASDLGLAVARRAGASASTDALPSDPVIMAYVAAMVRLTDAHAHTVSLTGCGVRKSADLLWICVRAALGSPAAELSLSNQLLCDLFDDQVNVVQVLDGKHRGSALFTRGDGPKRLF